MDQSGDELLTRARFPEEKDRRVARGGRPDLLHDLGPRGARADRQPLLAWITLFALQVVDLPPEGPRLEGAVQNHFERVRVRRLQDVVARPRLDAGDRRGDRSLPGQHDDRQLGIGLLHPADQVQAVGPGHLQIGQDQIDRRARQRLERRADRRAQVDVVPAGPQELAEGGAHVRLVLHDEEAPAGPDVLSHLAPSPAGAAG